MKNPLVAPAAAFAAGIVLVRLADFGWAELAVCAGGFGLLALFGHRRRWPWLRSAAMGLSVLALGGLDAVWHQDPPVPPIPEGPLLSGCVVEPAVASGDRHQFTLELRPGVRARISTSSPADLFVYGRRVQVEASLRPVHYNSRNAKRALQQLAGKQQ